MTEPFKWVCLGDLQIPYHDKRAVALTLKVMKALKPDAIDIVGDIDDQLEYSQFSDGTTDDFFSKLAKNQKDNEKAYENYKKYEEAFPGFTIPYDPAPVNPLPMVKENAMGARQFYTDVRTQHPDADIHASLGNHDIRVFKYMDKKAPDYVDELTPNMLWGLDDLGITWRMYHERPFKRFGDMYVHHGTTSTTTGLAVKNDIENLNVSLIRGHDHRGGVVYKSFPIPGQGLAGLGCGHLCDPDAYGLRYADNPTWEQGFGLVYVIDGKAHLQFIPIRNSDKGYTCVVEGKVFYE